MEPVVAAVARDRQHLERPAVDVPLPAAAQRAERAFGLIRLDRLIDQRRIEQRAQILGFVTLVGLEPVGHIVGHEPAHAPAAATAHLRGAAATR
jgi:hypothetical protein